MRTTSCINARARFMLSFCLQVFANESTLDLQDAGMPPDGEQQDPVTVMSILLVGELAEIEKVISILVCNL